MPTVFISYSRESHDLVRSIAEDLQALGYQTWFDQALTGGQAWWDLILEEIQKCDVFAFALEPESFSSAACKREYTYAARLGKSILPVLVADGVPTDLLPEALAQIQFVDYRRGDREALRALAKALSAIPPSASLPDPLPERPPVPISYLGGLREQVEASDSLSFAEQTELLLRLKNGLRNVKDAEQVRTLLKFFRNRDDLYAKVADEIDSLLADTSVQGRAAEYQPIRASNERMAGPANPPQATSDLPNDVANTKSLKHPASNVTGSSSFRFFSFSGFWLPLIIALVLSVAGNIFGQSLRGDDRLMVYFLSRVGFLVFFVIVINRLIRWRRQKN